MSWLERQRDAAITSPSGARVTFDFEVVSYEYDPLGSAFNFPDAEGTYVQRQKNSSRRYPLRMFFHGANYDQDVKALEDALLEDGFFKLEHPLYGSVDVVPFGTVKRRDDLKSAANQAIVEIVWWQTLTELYPQSQVNPKSLVSSELVSFDNSTATGFSDNVDLTTVGLQAAFKSNNESLLKSLNVGITNLPTSFKQAQSKFFKNIDTLLKDPAQLSKSVTAIIASPAGFIAGLNSKRNYYTSLFNTGLGYKSSETNTSQRDVNQFHTQDLYVTSYLSGLIKSTVNGEFTTKPEALIAAEEILELFFEAVEWREEQHTTLGILDTGEVYEALQRLASIAAGYLVQLSFTLKQERRVVLTRARTIIDVVAELYGTVDSELDFFINSNNLSGSELLELPEGKEVVYYV